MNSLRVSGILNRIIVDDPAGAANPLLAALSNDEDLVAILRGHLHIENIVMQILERRVPDSQVLVRHLNYSQRCRALKALGAIPQKLHTLLNALGDIRNEFAHTLTKQLVLSDAKKLLDPLSKEHQQWISAILKEIPSDDKTTRIGVTVRLAIISLWLDMTDILRPSA